MFSQAGLGLCVSGTLFGMCNTLRQDGGDPLILSGSSIRIPKVPLLIPWSAVCNVLQFPILVV